MNPLAHLNLSLRDLVARKAGARIGYQDDNSEMGEVARSMETYRVTVDEAERQRWVKASVAEIADALQGAEQPDEFGKRLLSKLVPLVGGGCGAFHLLHEVDGRFHFTGGYGFVGRQDDKGFARRRHRRPAAMERKRSCCLIFPPSTFASVPACERRPVSLPSPSLHDRVLAVIEIASFTAERSGALLTMPPAWWPR